MTLEEILNKSTPDNINTAPPVAVIPIDYEKETRITLKTVLPEIKESIVFDGSWLCTEGGLLVVSGQKKAGKSNGIVYILATALMPEVDTDKTLLIRSNFTTKKVIYIDTEQSPQATQKFIRRVQKIAGLKSEPKNLIMHNIRKLSLKERLDFLENYILKMDNIGLLVIDGVADLVPSVNDEEKAKGLVDMIFNKIDNNISVVATIHEGKDNNGATGHLGQLLEKKCSGTVAFFKDRKSQTHRITCKMVREGADFEDINFVWDTDLKELGENGGFRLIDENEAKALKAKNDETRNAELVAVMNHIFAVTKEVDKKTLYSGFKKYDKSLNLDVKPASLTTAIKRKVDYAIKDLEIIEVTKDGNYNFKL